MKNRSTTYIALMACAFIWGFNSHAGILTIGEWQAAGVSHNSSTTQTAVATQDGLIFTVSISSVGGSAGNVSALTGQGDRLGVFGGNDNGAIDQGSGDVANPGNSADDEALKFTLSVSGGTLTSLELQDISLSQWGINESLTFTDGSTDYNYTSPGFQNESFNYTGTGVDHQMTGLTPLSIANVGGLGNGTWELTLYAREKLAGGDTTSTGFGVDDISFSYAIPEPSSMLLLFVGGVSCVWFRRKR